MDAEESMCRLCLKTLRVQSMILLNDNESFISAIHQITNVEAIVRPDHAVHMCQNCQLVLEQCMEFRQICIDNDSIFRQTYHEFSIEHIKLEIPLLSEVLVKSEEQDDQLPIECDNIGIDSDKSDQGHESDGSIEESGKEKQEEDSTDQKRQKRKYKTKNSGEKKKRVKKYKSRKDAPKVQCQYCGVMIAHYNLSKHQEIHNPDRPKFYCPHCPKFYHETRRLKIHINSNHTLDKLYSCDQCGKVYRRSGSLREHYNAVHCDTKRYECKICGQKFARAATRTHHTKMMHTTVRPWACEYCDKTFKLRGDWTIHTRIHTGEKPFACDICHKTFNKSYNVVIHKKSHRNDRKTSSKNTLETAEQL